MQDDIERVLFDESEILRGIDRVAAEVTKAYRGRDFTVVSVLKGSCVFAADLIRRIPIPLELAFVAASSYGDGTEAGELQINYFPANDDIEGRNLLLVDDILDTGRTLHLLKSQLMARGANEVQTCVFLDKPARRSVEFEADYRCFPVRRRLRRRIRPGLRRSLSQLTDGCCAAPRGVHAHVRRSLILASPALGRRGPRLGARLRAGFSRELCLALRRSLASAWTIT